jgi:branched-chain amino acid transport system permease protein
VLVAIGFNIIYSTTKIVNFAQGEFLMLGAMIEYILLKNSIPIFLSVLISSILVALIAVFIYSFFISKTKNANELSLIIMTIGISILIKGVMAVGVDKNAHSVKHFLPFSSVSLFKITFSSQYLIVIAIGVFLVALLYFYLKYTLSGKIMLAVSSNSLASKLFGIDVNLIQLKAFALSGFIGAIAGATIAPISFAQYDMGVMFGLKGFAACVVGGFGNNTGAMVGGLIIGISESLASGYISSSYKDLIAFLIMIIVLFVKPSGLFASKDVERV